MGAWEWEAEDRALLEGVSFPVFVVEGLGLEVNGWGEGGDGSADMVSVLHQLDDDRWIEVESEIAEDRFHLPDARRDAVERLRYSSDAPVGTPSQPRPFRVDGIEVRFAFASSGDRWVAIGAAGDVTITMQAQGIGAGTVELRAGRDMSRLLDGGMPEYRPHRQARDVLDPRRIVELADGTALEDLGATLAGFARGALALLVSEEPEPSWIGGEPALPAGAPWPGGHHGPMTFVAQLSLAGLDPSVWIGPTSGHLHVFCDIEPESGAIEGEGACAIVHTPAGVELHPRGAPSEIHENNRIPRQFVTPRAGLTLPDAAATPMLPLGLGFEGERRSHLEHLWKLNAHLHAEQGWHVSAGQLLGWPTWQNDDSTEHLASLRNGQAQEWALLLQTDAVEAELYVMLPAADLAAARFDRAEAIVEHD